jgi:hypothetical protein
LCEFSGYARVTFRYRTEDQDGSADIGYVMGHTPRLTVTLLVACGSCATLIGAALIYAGPAFPAAQPRHAAAARPAEHVRHRDAGAPASQPIDPALFSPGACLAFAPTSGDQH